jgi:phage-related protein
MWFISDVINGVKYMIETFKRIICFLASVPKRVSNINAGFENIFNGINEEFDAIGKSFGMGVESISLFGLYVGEFIKTYSMCGFKFVANFFGCVFYYIIDIIVYCIKTIIYLFIQSIYWVIYAIFKVDISYVEKQASAALSAIDKIISPYLGLSSLLNIPWPRSVREKCYLCKRLKSSAVKKKATNIGVTFNEKIPNLFGKSRGMMRRGRHQFEEIFKTFVRPPSQVY